MKINGVKVDTLEKEVLGSLSKTAIRGVSYYTPIRFPGALNEEEKLNRVYITFEEIAELDKFINDMLILRATAIRHRGYEQYDSSNNPLSPIEDYIHSVVNKDIQHIMYELAQVKKEVEGKQNEI